MSIMGIIKQPYYPSKLRSRKSHAVQTRAMAEGKKPSQTTGRTKGIRPSALAKYMCRSNRSYKHPRYEAVMSKLGSRVRKG